MKALAHHDSVRQFVQRFPPAQIRRFSSEFEEQKHRRFVPRLAVEHAHAGSKICNLIQDVRDRQSKKTPDEGATDTVTDAGDLWVTSSADVAYWVTRTGVVISISSEFSVENVMSQSNREGDPLVQQPQNTERVASKGLHNSRDPLLLVSPPLPYHATTAPLRTASGPFDMRHGARQPQGFGLEGASGSMPTFRPFVCPRNKSLQIVKCTLLVLLLDPLKMLFLSTFSWWKTVTLPKTSNCLI